MKFQGTFNTLENTNSYKVEIGDGLIKEIIDPTEIAGEIAESAEYIMFDADPVNITCKRQNLNKRIIISQCEVNLISNMDLTDYLFVPTNRSVPLKITEVTDPNKVKHVFFGYVDPLQFSQGFAHSYEQISITATDPLGALEDLTIDKLTGVNIDTEKTPYELIALILNKVGVSDIMGLNDQAEYHINSEVIRCLKETKLQCKIFFGDDKDDYKSLYDVLETICTYFNLYVAMKDNDTALFSCTVNNALNRVDLSPFRNKVTDDSTSIGMDDVYTQVQLTCNIEPVEELVESFTDKDKLYSDYANEEHYMTEMWSQVTDEDRNNILSWVGFYHLVHSTVDPNWRWTPDQWEWEWCYTSDNYVYVLRNDAWDFGSGVNKNYIEYMGGSATTPMNREHQYDLLYWLAQEPCRAALVGFKKAQPVQIVNTTDTSTQKADLEKWLVISLMGHGTTDGSEFSKYEQAIYNHKPICTYTNMSSNILSPVDEETTNYIVVSGTMLLNPLQPLSARDWGDDMWSKVNHTFQNTVDGWTTLNVFDWGGHLNQTGIDSQWMYYQQKWDKAINQLGGVYGFLSNNANKALKYDYSAPDDRTDKISKLPLLACQLTVGEGTSKKYCLEKLWLGEEGINQFMWATDWEIQQLEQQQINAGLSTDDPNFYHLVGNEYFTIGIDPKIDDCIVGQKYQFSSNSVKLGLDKEGMCIPVKASDNLSGKVEFKIIGPYNAAFNNYGYVNIKVSPWDYSTVWLSNKKSVLANAQSMMIGDFKIELTSDNGGRNELNTTKDNDLVYYSNTDPTYLEPEELSVDICTPLTTEECQTYGIKIQNSNSYVYWNGGTPFRGFTSGQNTVKPEHCLVDYLYKEECSPSRIFETQVKANTFANGIYGNALNSDMLLNYYTGLPVTRGVGQNLNFRIMSYEQDLKYKTIDIQFRENKTVTNEQI